VAASVAPVHDASELESAVAVLARNGGLVVMPDSFALARRAILKATDLCASNPERAARFIVSRGYSGQLDYAVQAIREIPYMRWRDYDPEDTVRFYALRLREVGMTKNNAKKIIAQGTDWRFFNEIKRELKT